MIEMILTAVEILVNICHGMIYVFFTGEFLSLKKSASKPVYYLLGGSVQAILITVSDYYSVFSPLAYLLCAAGLFIFACAMLVGSMVKKLFACVLPVSVTFVITAGILAFFASVNNITVSHLISYREFMCEGVLWSILLLYYISLLLIYYIALRLLLKLVKSDSDSFGLYEWGIILAVMISSVLIAGVMHYIAVKMNNDDVRLLIAFSIMVLFMADVFVYHLINSRKKKTELEKELESVRLREYYQRQYIDSTKQQYDAMRKIRHDTKNSFLALSELIADKDYDRALSLINEYADTLSSVQTFVDTQNSVVNAVINSKLSYASANGIRSRCLSVSRIAGIKDSDLCSILSNALDNAITACLVMPVDSRELSLEINCENDRIYTFIITNTVGAPVLEINPQLSSTKQDKQEHGYGTKIIKEIAQKYNGRVDFYEEQNRFCCRIDLITDSSPSA